MDRLAVGGMAEVFLARELEGLDRLVVVKRMLPALAEDEEFVKMFLREAQIVARISHPNVVQILERGDADGQPFFAMEYVPGVSLKELIKAGRLRAGQLPVGLVVHLLLQACAGAHAAHEMLLPTGEPAGLVHRDLTPHNLMVDARAHVKLLDFGIAKDADVEGLTRTGVLRGKISYLSPEQARQEPLDRRTDVFALGVCAYELLTLERPFTMASEVQTIQRIIEGQFRPIRDLRPDVPLGIADAVHRALARDLATRWPTAEAFRLALKNEALATGVDDDPDAARRVLESSFGLLFSERSRHLQAAMQRMGPTTGSFPSVSDSAASGSGTRSTVTRQWMGPVLAGAGVAGLVALVVLAAVAALAFTAWWVATTPSGAPLRVVLAPVHSKETVLAEHQPLFRYLEHQLDRPILADVADSYASAADDLASGQAAVAILPGRAVQRAIEGAPGAEIIGWKLVDGSAESQGYLLISSSSTVTDLAELRGRTVCLTDPDSVTGWKLPEAYAKKQGMDLQRDFVVHRSGDHETVLRDLIAGTCTVAATYSGNLNSANERGIPASRIKVLAITGSTPNDAVVAGPTADAELRAALRTALERFQPQRDAGVSHVGDVERITGFRVDQGTTPAP